MRVVRGDKLHKKNNIIGLMTMRLTLGGFALRKGVDLKMNARLSTSRSDLFGSQDSEIKEEDA